MTNADWWNKMSSFAFQREPRDGPWGEPPSPPARHPGHPDWRGTDIFSDDVPCIGIVVLFASGRMAGLDFFLFSGKKGILSLFIPKLVYRLYTYTPHLLFRIYCKKFSVEPRTLLRREICPTRTAGGGKAARMSQIRLQRWSIRSNPALTR